MNPHLLTSFVEMEHVQHRDDVTVLIAIQTKSDFFKVQLHTIAREVLCSGSIHGNLRWVYDQLIRHSRELYASLPFHSLTLA